MSVFCPAHVSVLYGPWIWIPEAWRDMFALMEKQIMRFPKPHLFTVILIMLVIMLIAMVFWISMHMLREL